MRELEAPHGPKAPHEAIGTAKAWGRTKKPAIRNPYEFPAPNVLRDADVFSPRHLTADGGNGRRGSSGLGVIVARAPARLIWYTDAKAWTDAEKSGNAGRL